MAASGERRQFGRVPFRTRVTVTVPARQASVKATVMDISLDGVRLICRDPVVEGEDVLLTFQIKCPGGVQIEKVSSRVIFARLDDEAWVVGLRFNEVLDQRTTPLLVQAAASGDSQP